MAAIRDIRAAFMDSVETAARAAILARAMDGNPEMDPDEFVDGIVAMAAAVAPPPAGVTRGDVMRLVAPIGIAITERQLEESRRAEAEALAVRGCELRRAHPDWTAERVAAEVRQFEVEVRALMQAQPDWPIERVAAEKRLLDAARGL